MALDGVKQSQQLGGLLQHVHAESSCFRLRHQPLSGDSHGTAAQDCSSTSAGTIRFQSDTRLPTSLLERSR